MKIDRQLNLVVEIPREGEPSVFSHSAALPAEIVEQYHSLAGPTMNAMATRGYGLFAPRYAAAVLREVADEQALMSAGLDGQLQDAAKARAKVRVEGFFSEIRRRTHIVCMTENGWDKLPLADAKANGTVDDEELSQIENALVFFTFGLRSWVKAQRDGVSGGLSLFNARIESLNCTELIHSLQILTKSANSGASQDASPASSTGLQGRDSKSPSHGTASPGPALPRIAVVL